MVVAVDPLSEFEACASVLGSVADHLDLTTVDADGISQVVAVARRIQAVVESLVVRAGIRSDELAALGVGAPARDVLLGRGQVRATTARREESRVALSARSPALADLVCAGSLGPDHLDVLVRRLSSLDDDHLGRVDLDQLDPTLPADTFDRAVRRVVEEGARPDETGGAAAGEAARADSEVRHWFDARTGMGHVMARLDPERYEAVADAIDQHTSSLAAARDDAVSKGGHLAAEALVDLVCWSGARRAHLPQVTVVVDAATLASGRHDSTIAETRNGHGLSDHAVARLCCDAVLQRVVIDERGVPINVGRRHRTATAGQWSALRAAYSCCAWAGCDRPLSHCQAHHIRHWEQGGSTDLANLVPLCSHHHHLVHDGRWHIDLSDDRALWITRPDGELHAVTDPPSRYPPPRRTTVDVPAALPPSLIGTSP